MTAAIDVEQVRESEDGYTFSAAVKRNGHRSAHTITLSKDDYERLGGSASSPEDFIRTCLELLVEQVRDDDLMDRMDLREMISFYPVFGQEVRRRFGPPGST